MKNVFLAVVLALMATPAFAQKRINWDQPAPVGATTFTATDAAAYTYKYYVVNNPVGTALTGVACTTSNSPLVKVCSTLLPAALTPGTVFDLTASDSTDESAHSNTTTVTVPNTPTKLRITGAVTTLWRFAKKPF